jgi:carbonic anhydrase/acetyltransferase-like protein (isoleucine patch superfamily)
MNSPQIDPAAYVAATAQIFGDVSIEAEVVVMFGAVIRAELDRVTIGGQSNIQDNVVVHCDTDRPTRIGRRVTVGHAAVVHGATIGDHCLVGIGALALNGSTLGEGAWLAAGSVLPEGKTIPAWTLAVGAPAKPLRDLTEAEIARQDSGVDEYLRLATLYRSLGV